MTRDECVFCRIVDGAEPAEIVRRWDETIAIVPLRPVTQGHLLVLPSMHVVDALDDPVAAASTMYRAAELAEKPCNIITSVGAEATQTVFHLHVHVVPRQPGDGLALPWTGQAVTA